MMQPSPDPPRRVYVFFTEEDRRHSLRKIRQAAADAGLARADAALP